MRHNSHFRARRQRGEATMTGAAGSALIAIGVSIVGSQYGPLATVAAAAFIGAFVSLGEVETPGGRIGGAVYIVKYMLLAMAIAGTISYLIERYTTIPAKEILVLVALVIGWIGGRWKLLITGAINGVLVFIGKRTGGGQ